MEDTTMTDNELRSQFRARALFYLNIVAERMYDYGLNFIEVHNMSILCRFSERTFNLLINAGDKVEYEFTEDSTLKETDGSTPFRVLLEVVRARAEIDKILDDEEEEIKRLIHEFVEDQDSDNNAGDRG